MCPESLCIQTHTQVRALKVVSICCGRSCCSALTQPGKTQDTSKGRSARSTAGVTFSASAFLGRSGGDIITL